jgi:hypothetical protein
MINSGSGWPGVNPTNHGLVGRGGCCGWNADPTPFVWEGAQITRRERRVAVTL